MNDGKNAEMTTKEECSTDAELIELGSVSEETKGSWDGLWYDGGFGKYNT